ncbi:hypothetical protein EW145_g6343 [Phellinidium pouzarii]|uniref:HMG box domain-containing protein n=1 Tax=Phellinidium pouzarii TaxID=167371 RepID=A0A4S4KXF9_9AGAM|nr:hypothetical protein EW145_g6343 [Phellinidium pouzarii]
MRALTVVEKQPCSAILVSLSAILSLAFEYVPPQNNPLSTGMPRFRNTVSSITLDMPSLDPEHSCFDEGTCSPSACLRHSVSTSGRVQLDDTRGTPPRTQQPTPQATPIHSPTSQPLPYASSAPLPKRKHTTRNKNANHIPRPRNAFILFRSYALAEKLVDSIQQNEASREIARLWQVVEPETRMHFEVLAIEEKRRHAEAYPDYKYAPNKVGGAPPTPTKKKSESSKGNPNTSPTQIVNVGTRSRPQQRPTKRSILTPETSPMRSSEPKSKTVADEDVLFDDGDSDEDISPLYDLFSGVFKTMPKPDPLVAGGQRTSIPVFSYPENDGELIIDNRRVPCLASSAFYNPTFVQGQRSRKVQAPPDHSKSAEDNYFSVGRSLRPIAPIWKAEAEWNYWEDPPVLSGPAPSAHYPATRLDSMNIAPETLMNSLLYDHR